MNRKILSVLFLLFFMLPLSSCFEEEEMFVYEEVEGGYEFRSGGSIYKDEITSYEILAYIDSKPVISIGGGAFLGCDKLTEIVIPNTIKKIGYNAFGGCTRLKNFEIPESVEIIEGDAFKECKSLTSMKIPASVKEISEGIFEDC